MSVLFDDSSLEYLSHDAVIDAAPLTMSCWFNSDDASVVQGLVSAADADGDVNYFSIMLYNSGHGTYPGKVGFHVRRSSSTAAVSSGTYSQGTWHHACGVTANSSSRYMCLDGVPGSEDTTSKTPVGIDNVGIGVLNRPSKTWYFSGMIAEVGIWSVALTLKEIEALAAGYAPPLIRPDALKIYVPLRRVLSSSDKYPIYNYEPSGDPLSFSENGTPETASHPRIICPQVPQISSVSLSTLQAPPVAMRHYRNMRVA